MKVLILGATGYIGGKLLHQLNTLDWCNPTGASRSRSFVSDSIDFVQLDTRDSGQLKRALKKFDCVVNCVAGDYRTIAVGASNLAEAAIESECRKIIHLSSMSVYGRAEGELSEDAPLDPSIGWYARAKCEAEKSIGNFVTEGGEAVILRPGCVYGPGSELWVGRIARWLRAGRLGDLGVGGDGWSNLVHVNDVCVAISAAIRLTTEDKRLVTMNLAAPDSPRWNKYFVDLAIAIAATPVKRISPRQLKRDAYLRGPPLKTAERLLRRLGVNRAAWLADAVTPLLVQLWEQEIRLRAHVATQRLSLDWISYETGLRESAAWFCGDKK